MNANQKQIKKQSSFSLLQIRLNFILFNSKRQYITLFLLIIIL